MFGNDVKVADEDDFLSRNNTIKANNKIVKERIWTGLVTSKIMKQALKTDTDAQLHDERIITVREEHQRDVTNVKRSGEWLNKEFETARMSKTSGWNREEHSH